MSVCASLFNAERRPGAIYVGFPRAEAVARLVQHVLVLIADVAIAQVVNKDEDDVGLLAVGGRNLRPVGLTTPVAATGSNAVNNVRSSTASNFIFHVSLT